jgi:periplasmic protein CpxP/Spy
MKMRQLSLLTMVILFAVASVAFAQAPQGPAGPPSGPPAVAKAQGDMPESGHPCMCMPMREHGMEFLAKKLGVTDDQKKQFRAIRVGFEDRTRKSRTALFSLKDEKRAMLMSGTVDQKKLAAMDDQIVKLKTEILAEKLKMKRDKLALLTPEQMGLLADFITHKPHHFGMRGGHGMGEGEHFRGHEDH